MLRFFFVSMSIDEVFLWKVGRIELLTFVWSIFWGVPSGFLDESSSLQIRVWRVLFDSFFSSNRS